MKKLFKLKAPFKPAGSQPAAIKRLNKRTGNTATLVGVTGSGKTFTLANIIANQDKPVLVLSPNKTLAAQLYEEFSLFFPENKVCYFVSYYDYYQPESYMPAQDLYIPKETKINTEIERLRIEATASLINRRDTIIIASVSSIYSLGNPDDYRNLALSLKVGQSMNRMDLIRQLIFIQYLRNDLDKSSGTFQVLGNTIEINLPYQKEKLRIELSRDTIETLQLVSKLNNALLMNLDNTVIFPAKHFVTTEQKKQAAIASIKAELTDHLPKLPKELYRERLQMRVKHDIEMLKEVGYCSGIENYSVHFDGRCTREPPFCLLNFYPDDFLLIIDESHIAIPQLRGMYAGDRARKQTLVEFGFRLPSAFDNRPLTFEEVKQYFKDVIFVSATPSDYELNHSDIIVEQLIRPTGLLDPKIELHIRKGQIDHLIEQINQTATKRYRSLVTVLTKKLAEELANHLEEKKIKVCYLHSDLKTPQRTELLQKLRLGIFDCLVGVNLLREGLDLPEVALVAIMDADVESFLRDKRSLIQIIGRAARNNESRVIMYADTITKSMQAAIDETNRRRALQESYNKKHKIIPQSVKRDVTKSIANIQHIIAQASAQRHSRKYKKTLDKQTHIIMLKKEMFDAADRLDFEKAIALRNEIFKIKRKSQ
ncbi:excinuclease ABC subunit UvrB [Candidatus Dependentiae bacterium]|nr:MAG: excinuclease ABC subunit UvrB [Candidatus Dependentiae bacterium]